MPAKPKAYSYIRFSTAEQTHGDSLRRQLDAATRYAAVHDLELDERLSFRDLGVSGFTGENEETGRLGDFLRAVEHGDIAKGSYLLVESLDRLSRQKPRKAVNILTSICEAGIVVVTLDDQRIYTEETLDNDPLSLLVAVLVATRAHEESAKKGMRVAAAWSNKRKAAAESHTPMTALCPGWLNLTEDRKGFTVIKEREAVVQRIFRLALDGKGHHSIAQTLNRENVPVFGRGQMWHRSYISKLLKDGAVVGRFVPHQASRLNGRKVRTPTDSIENFYPPIIEAEVFDKVSNMASGRSKTARSPVANILAGLARCPKCSATMTRVNKGSVKKAGTPHLVCTKAKAGAACTYKSVKLSDLELALSRNAGVLLGYLPSPSHTLQSRWEKTDEQISVTADEIQRLVAAIAEVGHSKALLTNLRDCELAHQSLADELASIEHQMADTFTNRVLDTVHELVDAALDHQPQGIEKINALLRQLFTHVEINYLHGSMYFYWKHAEGEFTQITYGMPSEI